MYLLNNSYVHTPNVNAVGTCTAPMATGALVVVHCDSVLSVLNMFQKQKKLVGWSTFKFFITFSDSHFRPFLQLFRPPPPVFMNELILIAWKVFFVVLIGIVETWRNILLILHEHLERYRSSREGLQTQNAMAHEAKDSKPLPSQKRDGPWHHPHMDSPSPCFNQGSEHDLPYTVRST